MTDTAQPDEDQRLCRIVTNAIDYAEPAHKTWRRKANRFFKRYMQAQELKSQWRAAAEPDRDQVLRQAVSTWGSDISIAMGFGIIEAQMPMLVSNPPRMLARPQNSLSSANVQNVQDMIFNQQQKMNLELKLQTIGKDGLMFGLGIGKGGWRTEYRDKKVWVQSEQPVGDNPTQLAQGTRKVCIWDDPDIDSVDPFDFFWDPNASGVESARFLIHRTWRDMDYIREKAQLPPEQGGWRNLDDVVKVASLGDATKRDEVWVDRMKSMGYAKVSERETKDGSTKLHEVLEFHDGRQVITVLDREICVAQMENPYWHGELPFYAYRPTEIAHAFHGIGEIEMIEQLSIELDELRRGRRDNAKLALQRPFAYHEGLLETANFKFGPGIGIPVNGDPREIIQPIQIPDIPFSSYQEEERLKDDFKFVSGIADATTEGQVQGTATGAQLVYAAASRRMQLKTRRLELEVLVPFTSQACELNQQRIIANREIPTGVPPRPGEADRRWAWRTIAPLELQGEFDWYPDGTLGVENTSQDRTDGMQLWTMWGQDPSANKETLFRTVATKFGIDHPEQLYAPPQPEAPAAVLDILAQRGVPKPMIAQALMQALRERDGDAGPPSSNGASPPPAQEPAAA